MKVRTDYRRDYELNFEKKKRERRDENYLERKRRASKAYYHKPENKLKINVRRETRRLVALGEIKRSPCEKCGNKKSHAHHEDYTKPREVRWLCPKCHGREHRPAPHTEE